MNTFMFKEYVTPFHSSLTQMTFVNSPFSKSSELVAAFAIIVGIAVICALTFVLVRKKKRSQNVIQQIKEAPERNQLEKLNMKGKPENPQTTMELERLKGIGTKTAEKLKTANIADISELAKASANDLAQKTGISEKLLSKWIEEAVTYKQTEN